MSTSPVVMRIEVVVADVAKALEVEKAKIVRVVVQMRAVQLDFLTGFGVRFAVFGSARLTFAPPPHETDKVADLQPAFGAAFSVAAAVDGHG
ncbi:hypothetical protein [Fibrella forsythiae]|uniref:Uncharacterized protein n=1 Tax=Fibrella forsythiae TaxID=2817061 RepID=A0ABS3JM57_9BACT|nr:hypothetical protein [Fibrella forsythiae]MBO0951078.1 hypothetical protein [Fibrella forsythiae]